MGQLHDDEEVHPVYFWSRQLTKAERNYHVMDQECLAIIATCIKLRPYILGGKIAIYGNHTVVSWLFNKVNVGGRHA